MRRQSPPRRTNYYSDFAVPISRIIKRSMASGSVGDHVKFQLTPEDATHHSNKIVIQNQHKEDGSLLVNVHLGTTRLGFEMISVELFSF